MSTLTIKKSSNAIDIQFSEVSMSIFLSDGRVISIPLEWFPKLRDASTKDLETWRLIGEGEGIHWTALDEDILVENLLN